MNIFKVHDYDFQDFMGSFGKGKVQGTESMNVVCGGNGMSMIGPIR